ncbi:hypothetical protein D3C75_1040290 [compost metagenome]
MLSNPFEIATEEAIWFRGISPLFIYVRFAVRISVCKSFRENLIPNGVLHPFRTIKYIDGIQIWETEKAIIFYSRRKALLPIYSSLITIMELEHIYESIIFW